MWRPESRRKNPQPLELAKGRAPQLYGALMAALASTKVATFSNNGERPECSSWEWPWTSPCVP